MRAKLIRHLKTGRCYFGKVLWAPMVFTGFRNIIKHEGNCVLIEPNNNELKFWYPMQIVEIDAMTIDETE